jgi:hypothetical protein
MSDIEEYRLKEALNMIFLDDTVINQQNIMYRLYRITNRYVYTHSLPGVLQK